MDRDSAFDDVRRHRGQLTAVPRADGTAPTPRPQRRDVIVDPQTSEPAQRVGEKTDARAHHVGARRPLEDYDVVAGAVQRDRGAEPPDAASDDDHAHPLSTLRVGQTRRPAHPHPTSLQTGMFISNQRHAMMGIAVSRRGNTREVL
jgi:hypothetical protein